MTPLPILLAQVRPLGLTPAILARLCGFGSPTSIYRMLAGAPAWEPGRAWLEALAQWWRENPPPRVGGRNDGT